MVEKEKKKGIEKSRKRKTWSTNKRSWTSQTNNKKNEVMKMGIITQEKFKELCDYHLNLDKRRK